MIRRPNERPQRPQTSAPPRDRPGFLSDGNIFCIASTEFDTRWRWNISGDRAHEPVTPTCILLFGQSRPARISVLKRVGNNKTMVRIEDGNLAGKTGFTDAFLPE
jgi:hypothetical protein